MLQVHCGQIGHDKSEWGRLQFLQALQAKANPFCDPISDGIPPCELYRELLADGVRVRDISGYVGCERALRVTVGTPSENARFLASLKHAVTSHVSREEVAS